MRHVKSAPSNLCLMVNRKKPAVSLNENNKNIFGIMMIENDYESDNDIENLIQEMSNVSNVSNESNEKQVITKNNQLSNASQNDSKSISIEDIKLMLNTIIVISKRGGFQIDEFKIIGNLYEKLLSIINK